MTEEPGERSSVGDARRADVFGELMPLISSDERPESWGEAGEDSEEALRREVPPHHG